jgi:hypothetical protein
MKTHMTDPFLHPLPPNPESDLYCPVLLEPIKHIDLTGLLRKIKPTNRHDKYSTQI